VQPADIHVRPNIKVEAKESHRPTPGKRTITGSRTKDGKMKFEIDESGSES